MTCEDCPYTLPCYQDRFKHNFDGELLTTLCPTCGGLQIHQYFQEACGGPALFFCNERKLDDSIREAWGGRGALAFWVTIRDPGPGEKLHVRLCADCYAAERGE